MTVSVNNLPIAEDLTEVTQDPWMGIVWKKVDDRLLHEPQYSPMDGDNSFKIPAKTYRALCAAIQAFGGTVVDMWEREIKPPLGSPFADLCLLGAVHKPENTVTPLLIVPKALEEKFHLDVDRLRGLINIHLGGKDPGAEASPGNPEAKDGLGAPKATHKRPAQG